MVKEMSAEKLADILFDRAVENNIIDSDGCFELFKNYDEEVSDREIENFLESSDPAMAFEDWLTEIEINAEGYYLSDVLDSIIDLAETEEEKALVDEVRELLIDRIAGHYDRNDWNRNVKVNILLDTGNYNRDCTCDNVLNYCGEEKLDNRGSILWLARQFRKENELRKEVGYVYNRDKYRSKDKFIHSCIEEYENLTSMYGTLTFLVEMPLFEIFNVIEEKKRHSKGYDGRFGDVHRKKPYIKVGKNTMCGLYDAWLGSGSILEIQLPSELKIPLDVIGDIQLNVGSYSVNGVYGLIGSCWKEVVEVKA
jgi:hypothetical protein